jgi:hypothetical protein
MTRGLIASALAALALAAAPCAAVAQDAGGNQYIDPLVGGGGGTGHSPGGSSGSPGGTTSGAGSSQSSSQIAQANTTSSATGSSSSGSGGKPGLPATGFPVGLLALTGLMAVGAGVALRPSS